MAILSQLDAVSSTIKLGNKSSLQCWMGHRASAWLAGVGELRPEWLLLVTVVLGMRVVPKHHLHETLETATGCTQLTFCSIDASSWWRRPCPRGWATRSC